jgi:hypothetical protein
MVFGSARRRGADRSPRRLARSGRSRQHAADGRLDAQPPVRVPAGTLPRVGGVPERPNGAVLKTAAPFTGAVGSNPTPAAHPSGVARQAPVPLTCRSLLDRRISPLKSSGVHRSRVASTLSGERLANGGSSIPLPRGQPEGSRRTPACHAGGAGSSPVAPCLEARRARCTPSRRAGLPEARELLPQLPLGSSSVLLQPRQRPRRVTR